MLTRKQRACPAGAKHKLPQDILVKQNKNIDYSAEQLGLSNEMESILEKVEEGREEALDLAEVRTNSRKC